MTDRPGAITPARMKLIRASVELTPTGEHPAFEDRALLLAHVDWLERVLQHAERTAANGFASTAANPPPPPLLLYFETDEARTAFVKALGEKMPDIVARTVL
jgi:hypothetical protein